MAGEVKWRASGPEDVLEMPSGDQYLLVSIINHIGPSLNEGHYITFVKKGEFWQEKNDIYNYPITKKELVTDNNYIYFYEKMIRPEATSNLTTNDNKMT